jgi:hypothetical protein
MSSRADSRPIELSAKYVGAREVTSCCFRSRSSRVLPLGLISLKGGLYWICAVETPRNTFRLNSTVVLCVPSSAQRFAFKCFSGFGSLSLVAFEAGSKLSCIEDSAFSGCRSLSSICIPRSVARLPKSCFSWCSALVQIDFEFGSQLSCIKTFAFTQCSSLSALCIPSSVQKLCRSSFSGCDSLSILSFQSDSKLMTIQPSPCSGCPSLRSSSVQQLCPKCFFQGEFLSIVSFEAGSQLVCIDAEAFRDCSDLSSKSLPSELRELGPFAFAGTNLQTISIADENCHFD